MAKIVAGPVSTSDGDVTGSTGDLEGSGSTAISGGSSVTIETVDAEVSSATLPVYASASTSSRKLGTLKVGQKVTVYAYNADWAYIGLNGKYGYLLDTGEWLVEPRFDDAGLFFGGFAAVCLDGKWGYIDEQGALRIEPRFDSCDNFYNGSAEVELDGMRGLIDTNGAYLIEPKYYAVNSFAGDYAAVARQGAYVENRGSGDYYEYIWGVIDRTGALVLVTSVQDTVDSLTSMRDQMLGVFLLALAVVLVLAGFISRIVTRPVRELSDGIERMSKGDYQHRVHVKGRSELAQLAAAFNQMSEQVHNLDEARNQFVSNASHELKTPLATIKILVESMLYQDDMPPELRQEFLTDINREIDRLSSVVGDLLTLVHIDSHKLRLRREMMVFAETVRESVKRLQPLAKKRGQEISVEIADPCEMFADPGKLAQVCYNIIENAIKYTPDGGKITVRLRRMGRDAVLDISDTGVGIPEEDLAHVFDRFYRADKSRNSETGGFGIGLSMARSIAEAHGGSVEAECRGQNVIEFSVKLK